MAQALIALGSNLGDSRAILEAAIETLNKKPGIQVKTHSSWYETPPLGPPQPNYLNGCALLETEITPEELLTTLLEIEREFGRVRREKWGPRIIDLDLLLFDNLIQQTPQLQVPHPQMRQRAFVMIPLAEIVPNWIDPITGKTIAELAKNIDTTGINKL